MKRNHLLTLALMTSLGAMSFGSPLVNLDTAVTSFPAVYAEVQSQGPTKLPAENVDGSKVNAATQREASEIIKEFNANQAEDLMGSAMIALAKFEALHGKDEKNLSVMTWIGYLSTVTGSHARSIEVLEAIRNASQDEAVNVMNLRNLSASYYLSQQYASAAGTLVELDQKVPDQGDTLALLGSSFVLGKEYSKAISPLERAATLLSGDADSLRNVNVDLGISYSRTGDQEKAMMVFDRMKSDDLLTSVQLGWMGFIYLQNKRFDDAISMLERSYQIDSTNQGVVNNLANAYLNRNKPGDEAKAVAMFEELSGMGSGNPVADYNVGSLYLGRGEYAKAKPYLVRAARNGDPLALNNLGRAHEGLGEYAEAASNYSRASDLRPDNDTFAKNAGFALIRVGNDASAIKYLERAMNLNRSTDILLPLAGAYNRTGMGEKAMAIWMMPEVRDSRQNDASYWFNLGTSHAAAGQPAEAEAAYRKSLQIEPNNADVVNNLGVLLWNNENYAGALDCFKKQSAMQPESVDAKLNVAACHVRLGQINEAVEIWRGVVRSSPDRVDVRLDLADGLWNTGDTPGARFHYATVHRTNPNNARALNGLGMWALLQTQNDEAEDYFRKSIAADRKFIPGFQNLAVVLERQNKVAEAVKVLEAALAMAPNNDAVKQQLARLKS